MQSSKIWLSAIVIGLLCGASASAQDIGDFDPFVKVELSAPNSVGRLKDPTGQAPTDTVYSFAIPSGYCNKTPYDASGDSDCKQNSTRSSIRENVFATKKNGSGQPKQSWYGWAVYFPADFQYGQKQNAGHYDLVYWHNKQCPHLTFLNWAGRDSTLYLGTNRALGNHECSPGPQFRVADFKDLVGKWNRFEVFVEWAGNESGEVKVYLDGTYVVHYKGPTLTEGLENVNYFVFGVYLCCTKDVKLTKGTSALYTAVKRAGNRDGLFVEEDHARLKQLQQALNALGCDVGGPDGRLGARTRDQALSCKDFGKNGLPADLTVATIDRFLAAYVRKGVATLPAGKLKEPALDIALVSYPAQTAPAVGLVAPELVVHATESQTHRSGREVDVNSSIAGTVEKYKELKSFDFAMLGKFNFSEGTFYQLQFFFEDQVNSLGKVGACSNAIIKFPDGSEHAQINFMKNGNDFIASNAKCLIEALPKRQSKVLRFLMAHFTDIAVGMARDGSIDLLSHDGLKIFMNRVARGEIRVGML
ncbi:heparin lyase I family protein [Mesorhizobium sp.]|uniref:heparin lyase I family protein n=1 Tax=Mesorhizobium sp. TaxID=1871066 RepID=UPI0025B81718|nr:heparin lyase I family protein [Mesorhizobium sp.]